MRNQIIHVVSIKGFVKVETVAAALALDPDAVKLLMADLTREGYLENSRIGAKLSDRGKTLASELVDRAREEADLAELERFYSEFTHINQGYKESMTAWQIKNVGDESEPNDHTDSSYDQQVLSEMFKHHHVLADLIALRLASWPLLGSYAGRLVRAYEKVKAGDYQFVAGALIDSYHTVWFEFHEALIRLSGRDRASEAAAGRAD